MIRRALAKDLPSIGRIWNTAIRETNQTFNSREKTQDELVNLLIERDAAGHALLVVDEGEVVGFGTYSQFRGGVGYGRTMEHTLYLDPVLRGRGQGSALMAALEDHARDGGAHSLIGGIAGENEASILFHERLGYTRVATLPQVGYKFGRYMDLVLLQKFLT